VDAPGQAVELHARDDVERAATDGGVEGVQGRPLLLRPGDAVIDKLRDGSAAGGGKGPEGEELVLGGLAGRADAAVEADAAAWRHGCHERPPERTWGLAG